MEPGSELSKLCCSCTCSLRDANIWQKGDLKLPSSPRLWGWKFSTVIPRCGFLRSSLRFYLCLQESQWRLVERDGWAPRTCIYCFILYQSAGGKKLLWKGNRQSKKVSDFGKEHSVQRLSHFIKFQLQLSSPPHTQAKSSQRLNQPFKPFSGLRLIAALHSGKYRGCPSHWNQVLIWTCVSSLLNCQ